MSVVAEFYKTGGTWMHPIAFVSVVVVAVCAERIWFLWFRYNLNAHSFMAQIQKLIMANQVDRAIKLCNAEQHAALPRIVKAGLTRANKGETEITNAVEEMILEMAPLISKRMAWLPTLSSLATMLGLLGTIIGMIEAFAAVANAAPDQKQEMLANAIAIAMNTTAFGLMVAIPTMFISLILNTLVKKIMDEIDQYSIKLVNMLVLRGQGGTNPLNR